MLGIELQGNGRASRTGLNGLPLDEQTFAQELIDIRADHRGVDVQSPRQIEA